MLKNGKVTNLVLLLMLVMLAINSLAYTAWAESKYKNIFDAAEVTAEDVRQFIKAGAGVNARPDILETVFIE